MHRLENSYLVFHPEIISINRSSLIFIENKLVYRYLTIQQEVNDYNIILERNDLDTTDYTEYPTSTITSSLKKYLR